MNNKVLQNIHKLYEYYGETIYNDKKLLLLYWRDIDNIEITKETLATSDWVKSASSPIDIIASKNMFKIMKEDGE